MAALIPCSCNGVNPNGDDQEIPLEINRDPGALGTLFVDDIASSKAFYARVFAAETVWADDVSSVLKFGGLLINLREASRAPPLVEPLPVAPSPAGARALLTIRVADVDAVCSALRAIGVALLNGPIDRPWGRRTAAFADPSGHVWEIAQVIQRA